MRDGLKQEVEKYLSAERVTATGIVANGYTLRLEFALEVPEQFRAIVAQLQDTYGNRLTVATNVPFPRR